MMAKMSASRGFVYVVNTQDYLNECLRSYSSLRKHMPDVPVTIVTHPYLYRDVAGVEWTPLTRDYDSPIVKVEAYNAPYDVCIFLDSDTRVLRDIRILFEISDAFDLALAHEPTRGGTDYKTSAPGAFCELNTGVIVFRKSDRVQAFFQKWLSTYQAMRDAQGLVNDQASFRQTLWESPDLRHATLPPEFHLITNWAAALYWEAHLLHGRDDMDRIEAIINSNIGSRVFLPGYGCVSQYRGRKALLANYLNISLRTLRILLRPSILSRNLTVPGSWHERDKIERESAAVSRPEKAS